MLKMEEDDRRLFDRRCHERRLLDLRVEGEKREGQRRLRERRSSADGHRRERASDEEDARFLSGAEET